MHQSITYSQRHDGIIGEETLMRKKIKIFRPMIIPFKSGTDDVANDCSNHLVFSLSFLLLVILLNIAISLIKDIFILDFVFDPNNTAKGFLDFLLTSSSALPAIETHNFTMLSISATMRSTITGVLRFFKPLKSSVSAAIPLSTSCSGTTSFLPVLLPSPIPIEVSRTRCWSPDPVRAFLAMFPAFHQA